MEEEVFIKGLFFHFGRIFSTKMMSPGDQGSTGGHHKITSLYIYLISGLRSDIKSEISLLDPSDLSHELR